MYFICLFLCFLLIGFYNAVMTLFIYYSCNAHCLAYNFWQLTKTFYALSKVIVSWPKRPFLGFFRIFLVSTFTFLINYNRMPDCNYWIFKGMSFSGRGFYCSSTGRRFNPERSLSLSCNGYTFSINQFTNYMS